MKNLIVPKNYLPNLDILNTEIAIKLIKDTFEKDLAKNLNLTRVSAPLFVDSISGLNDNLNGVERPVEFDILNLNSNVQIIHSLAKWKRLALAKYGFENGFGLYTDMNAIRRDEVLDNLHSAYVDQWDWEKIITKNNRTLDYLKNVVKNIVKSLKDTEKVLHKKYCGFKNELCEDIFFITSQELEDTYPDLTPKQRENQICRKHKTVFLMQIGGALKSGVPHDGRAPDYDDWSLNGDILIWNPILECAFEISSMGIRVDNKALDYQLNISNNNDRRNLDFHKLLLNDNLPLTIGGGIGQSRICMLLLEKAHIGEVQASIWSKEMIDYAKENNIYLL